MIIEYKGFPIEFNFYGENEYSIQYEGDDFVFPTEKEAKEFIDSISPKAHFSTDILGKTYYHGFW